MLKMGRTFRIVGSHSCPNTLYSIVRCKEEGLAFKFVDLSGSLDAMKEFLALHENSEVYREYREMSGNDDYVSNGKIGLPCFVFDDGFRTLNLNEAITKSKGEIVQ